MNINEICQKIKSLINSIFSAHRALEDATAVSHLRARDATALLIEAMKKVAPLKIKYSGPALGNVDGKNLVWHKEYGIGESMSLRSNMPGHVEPLMVDSGDFPVENLVHAVQSQLDQTLRNILSKQDRTTNRVAELEGLIETLRQWEKIDSESDNS